MRKIIGVLSSTAAMKSLEAVKGKRCKAGSWGTFVHIDIFQGGYFFWGEVFCLGFGFLFLTPLPREYFVLSSLFVAISFKCCGFSLDLAIVLSSENIEKRLVLINWNCLPVILVFYIRKPATVMESCI